MGGGLNFLLSTDVVFVGEKATFQQVYADYALSPDMGGMWALQRIVGPQHAKALAFTADTIDAARAKEIGMVYEVTPAGQAMERARAFAEKVAAKSPVGITRTKRMSNSMQDYTMETYFQAENDYLATGALSSDFKELMAAAQAQRAPEFKGY